MPDVFPDFTAEAIRERDPDFELPPDDGASDSSSASTMSLAEERQWAMLVARRPGLGCLRSVATD
jgi:hypothetical protein